MKPYLLFAIVLLQGLASCKRPDSINTKKISAIVGQDTIFLDDVDDQIKQQLHLQLHQVYQMRKIATSKLIDDKMIELEARKQNIDPDSLLNSYLKLHNTEADLEKFIRRNKLEDGVSDLKKDLRHYDLQSPEGQQVLHESFRKNLRRQLLAELKKKYPSQTFLVPPPQPQIVLDDLNMHYRGNENSKVTLTLVSDFECDNCRRFIPKLDSLYLKYGDRIRFAFTNYASYIGLASMAAESAARQNKFWEMHDLIFKNNLNYRDTADFVRLASQLNLNIPEFLEGIKDSVTYETILKNYETVNDYGIMGTPTVIVNKRIVINSSQTDEIENTIEEEMRISAAE